MRKISNQNCVVNAKIYFLENNIVDSNIDIHEFSNLLF